MQTLKSIRIAGWKSIRDQTIELGPMTIAIGANGAGKSNLLSVFRLLNAVFAVVPGFRNFVAKSGYSESLLHYGSKQTPVAELELVFQTHTGETRYLARWAASTATGSLFFADESISFRREGKDDPIVIHLGSGHMETNLIQAAEGGDKTASVVLKLVRSCRLFHFHDTSDTSAVRKPCAIEANRFLYPDAGNLAAILYLFQEKHPEAYRRIVATVRQMIPDFADFVLEPSRLHEKQIFLNWTHEGSEHEFGPHQLSDGSIRFIALATLFLQPPENLPLLVALDEPELGLHPAALQILAGLAKAASNHCQIVLATQSAAFLDEFEPEDVVVVSSRSGETEFQRLNPVQLSEWRESYSLGELWEKNVIGGGPYG